MRSYGVERPCDHCAPAPTHGARALARSRLLITDGLRLGFDPCPIDNRHLRVAIETEARQRKTFWLTGSWRAAKIAAARPVLENKADRFDTPTQLNVAFCQAQTAQLLMWPWSSREGALKELIVPARHDKRR
jgi:hypothetical protein